MGFSGEIKGKVKRLKDHLFTFVIPKGNLPRIF